MDDALVIATSNPHKLREIREKLKDVPLRLLSLADFAPLPEPAEDGASLLENAVKKAVHYARLLGHPCLADDTGLKVDALGGRPGIHTARYAGPGATGKENCEKLLQEMKGFCQRTAHFACVIAVADTRGRTRTWEGRCEGEILTARRGSSEFGYDPLFFLPERNQTLAELTLEETNQVSHRSRALAQLTAELDQLLTLLRAGRS